MIESVHPKLQGADPAVGHQLRMDLPDLVEVYIREIERGL